jgi:hypothetical protein
MIFRKLGKPTRVFLFLFLGGVKMKIICFHSNVKIIMNLNKNKRNK